MATTNLSHYDKATIPNAKSFRFGIVVSEWNPEITKNLQEGAVQTLLDCGALEENIYSWEVPGSFELVFGCKKMIQSHQVDAVIAIGNVIQGETRHFDFVCDGLTQGIVDLNLKYDVPVIF
ncbi:MAG: 6,7-dimethyl-8-ribityllumazine synthase, partial [Polaribacter sp.]|nr:6,7-dimethyl-8-ribityllumazine synthase [Polaribacter sp.]